MWNRVVAALLMVVVAAPAAATGARPWSLEGATTAPVPDESRSGHWWWPERPSEEAARSEAWGNRGVVYRNLPPTEKAAPSPVQPPPPPPDLKWPSGQPKPIISNVHFDRDSAEVKLGPNGTEAIHEIVAYMELFPHDTVLLEGHTCNIGSAEYNLALGQRRADAVRDYMIANGIDPGRVSTVSYGLTRPALPNETAWNRSFNRRVLFIYQVVNAN